MTKTQVSRGWPTVALVLAAAGLTVAATVLFLHWREHEQTGTARRDGVAAAARLTEQLLTFDYRKPAEAERAESGTTGKFAAEYHTLLRKHVQKNASSQEFVTKVKVRDRSLVSASPDRVVAMLFLDQVTTSTALTGQRLDSSGVRVTMSLVDGRWLVSGLERI